MADPERYGFQRLEIYQLAHDLAVRIDAMTRKLPGFEKYEEGQQIRKSSKSVSSQIAEGYGLRKYKDKFLLYLQQAQASSDETLEHLMLLYETGSLNDLRLYKSLEEACKAVTAKINRFIIGVERNHSTPYYLRRPVKEEPPARPRTSRIENPNRESRIKNPESTPPR